MADDTYRYILTENANADVEEILEYIATELANPDAATAFVDAMDEKLETVCQAPKMGRAVENQYYKRTDIRRILVKNYIVYYLIDEDKNLIVVLRVIFEKRDQNRIKF